MKTMKRLAPHSSRPLMLAFVTALAISGCGTDSADQVAAETTSTTVTSAAPDQAPESPSTTPDTSTPPAPTPSTTPDPQGGGTTPPPPSDAGSTGDPGSTKGAAPTLPTGKNLTRDDFFNPPDNSKQAPFDVAGEKHEGIGVSAVGRGNDELELRLGNRYSRLTFNAGQADTSEASDTYLRVEIIANNATVSTTDVPFNEIKPFDVDVTNVNAAKIRLSKVDDKGNISYSEKKITAVLFDIQLQ
ncbi:NPCBM/NEW2 domain-containing protein [Actinomyces capricornis]|nr:NPCBM/NEW2 domain-containing protein [Actinomyces capricornis]